MRFLLAFVFVLALASAASATTNNANNLEELIANALPTQQQHICACLKQPSWMRRALTFMGMI